MKKKILLFTSTVAMLSITLMSNNAGPAHSGNGDKTGRLGLTCGTAGCHSGGGGTTTCTIQAFSKAGNPVSSFIPDSVYTIKLTGTNPTPSLSKFGFQMVCVSGTAQAGTWQNMPSNVHPATVSGISVLEHATALSKDGSGNYSVTVDWKATAVSQVTFYAIINAVNGDGTTSGDKPSAPTSWTLFNTNVNDIEKQISLKVSPNPISNSELLTLEFENATAGDYTLNAFDLTGKRVLQQIVSINTASHKININTEEWHSGMYHIQINKDDFQKVIPVVKK